MKKMLKYMSPLAPDDSGVSSVLYELGGIVVICDAGGCAGNVCGFDEPRWFTKRSALFSAGLRDMDAILGRDKNLIEKLAKVTEQVDAEFTAIIGTPVPAVIATDYKALQRMAEKKTDLPCLVFNTDGTKLYDEGQSKAYLEVFKRFAEESEESGEECIYGVIGATPLSTGCVTADEIKKGFDEKTICYGMDSTLNAVRHAGRVKKNFVIDPSGLAAARYLKEKFGTPYEMSYPKNLLEDTLEKLDGVTPDSKVLIIHQQAAANALRDELRKSFGEAETKSDGIKVASFFMIDDEFAEEGDVHIKDEDELRSLVLEGGFDMIIADKNVRKALPEYEGEFVEFNHYAV